MSLNVYKNGVLSKICGNFLVDFTLSTTSHNAIENAAVATALNTKQNSTDNNLQTTDKTIVGAINELKSSGTATAANVSYDDGTVQGTNVQDQLELITGKYYTTETAAEADISNIEEGQLVYTDDGDDSLTASNVIYDDGTSQGTTVQAAVSQLSSSVTGKQDKTDNTLQTTSKTVVGAINELNNDLAEHVLSFTNVTLNQNGALVLTGLDSTKDVVDKVVIKGSTITGTYHLIYTDLIDNRVFVQIINYTTNQPYANTSNVSFDVYYRTIN